MNDGLQLYVIFGRKSPEATALARAITAEAERRGVGVFFDEKSLPPGTEADDAMARGMAAAHGALVIWERSAASSSNVTKELDLARDYATPIVPVLLDTEIERHPSFRGRVPLDRDLDARAMVDRWIEAAAHSLVRRVEASEREAARRERAAARRRRQRWVAGALSLPFLGVATVGLAAALYALATQAPPPPPADPPPEARAAPLPADDGASVATPADVGDRGSTGADTRPTSVTHARLLQREVGGASGTREAASKRRPAMQLWTDVAADTIRTQVGAPPDGSVDVSVFTRGYSATGREALVRVASGNPMREPTIDAFEFDEPTDGHGRPAGVRGPGIVTCAWRMGRTVTTAEIPTGCTFQPSFSFPGVQATVQVACRPAFADGVAHPAEPDSVVCASTTDPARDIDALRDALERLVVSW